LRSTLPSRRLCAAAAVGTFGLLISAPPAYAAPPQECGFSGGTFTLTRDDGQTVAVDAQAGSPALGPRATVSSGGNQMSGNVTGGINGNQVDFRIVYDAGPAVRPPEGYNGTIFKDGSVRNGLTDPNVMWDSPEGSVKCLTDSSPGQPGTATVLKPTDIFDVPDGNGTSFKNSDGDPIFKSPGQVTLVPPELCRDNWCHVVAPEVPGGVGWIYIGEELGSYP